MDLTRYSEMLAEHGVQPFERIPWVNPRTERVEPRVLGEPLPLQWRVSRDEWDRLLAMSDAEWGGHRPPLIESRIFGWPVWPDDRLPPRSIILEPWSR